MACTLRHERCWLLYGLHSTYPDSSERVLLRQAADSALRKMLQLQAQLAYSGADLAPVGAYLDQLGTELRRRMSAANAVGGRRALELLNVLLFGPMSAEECVLLLAGRGVTHFAC